MNIDGLENINKSLSTYYLIYKITNNINGKYYIGQHITKNCLDEYSGSGSLICKAKEKYSISAFTKTILFDYSSFEEMNSKEMELVQLSNCFPYDKMSYNLTIGGNGGSKFISKSKDEIKEIFDKVNDTRRNWSDDKRKQYLMNQSNASKLVWKNKSEQFMEEWSQQMSNIQTKIHQNRTQEEQILINNKISNTKKNFSEQKRLEIRQKTNETLQSRSIEQIQKTKQKQKQSAILRNKNRTFEQKQLAIDNQKQTWQNKTTEEIQEGISKWRESMNNRTPEEIAETKRKMSDACKGSKFMVNLKTNHRLRVRKYEISRYLDLGYIFVNKRHLNTK